MPGKINPYTRVRETGREKEKWINKLQTAVFVGVRSDEYYTKSSYV